MKKLFFCIVISLLVIVFWGTALKAEAGENDCTIDLNGKCCSPAENFCFGGTMQETEECTRCCVGLTASCVKPPTKECRELFPKGSCYPNMTNCLDVEAVPATDCPPAYPYCCNPDPSFCTPGSTCEGKGYYCCGSKDKCTGTILITGFCDCGIYPPGESRCCTKSCGDFPSCSSLGGDCCQAWEECLGGNFKSAYNCTPENKCCVGGTCVEPSTDTCEELGGICCSNHSQECEGGNFVWAYDCEDLCCKGGTCVSGGGGGGGGGGLGPGTTFQNPLEYDTFEELVDAIVNFIFYIGIAVCPLIIIIGAFYLLTAGGDPKRIGTGKTIISYALIGLLVILFARALIYMIESVIGVKIGG